MFRPKTRYVSLPSPRAGVGEEVDRLVCPKCDTSLEPARLTAALRVCYRCGYHFGLRAHERIAMLTEPESFHEEDAEVVAQGVLGFQDSQPYTKRIEQSRADSGMDQAAAGDEASLADPTMGGVTASFASLGDVILAEPGAMIGFAGARVIQQATYETLPEGFQTAEFLWKHGMIDMVVPRPELGAVLRQLLDLYTANGTASDFQLPAVPARSAAKAPAKSGV